MEMVAPATRFRETPEGQQKVVEILIAPVEVFLIVDARTESADQLIRIGTEEVVHVGIPVGTAQRRDNSLVSDLTILNFDPKTMHDRQTEIVQGFNQLWLKGLKISRVMLSEDQMKRLTEGREAAIHAGEKSKAHNYYTQLFSKLTQELENQMVLL